jgi:hypothetical protein
VKHPDSKAYILKYHMDEELEMHLAKAHWRGLNSRNTLRGVCVK